MTSLFGKASWRKQEHPFPTPPPGHLFFSSVFSFSSLPPSFFLLPHFFFLFLLLLAGGSHCVALTYYVDQPDWHQTHTPRFPLVLYYIPVRWLV